MSYHDTLVIYQLCHHGFGLTAEEVASRTPLSPESVHRSFRRLLRTGIIVLTPETTNRYHVNTDANV